MGNRCVLRARRKLQDQGWMESFRNALKTQHPEVFDAVTKAGEDLLRESVFARCVKADIFLQSKYIVSETITSAGGILELQKFGVRLEIPAGALRGKEIFPSPLFHQSMIIHHSVTTLY